MVTEQSQKGQYITKGVFMNCKLPEQAQMSKQQMWNLLLEKGLLKKVKPNNKNNVEAYIPMIYANSTTDAEKLGRETDWTETVSDVVTGRGQKMWFIDGVAVPITDLVKVTAVAT